MFSCAHAPMVMKETGAYLSPRVLNFRRPHLDAHIWAACSIALIYRLRDTDRMDESESLYCCCSRAHTHTLTFPRRSAKERRLTCLGLAIISLSTCESWAPASVSVLP
jgi:hypothetical protein